MKLELEVDTYVGMGDSGNVECLIFADDGSVPAMSISPIRIIICIISCNTTSTNLSKSRSIKCFSSSWWINSYACSG